MLFRSGGFRRAGNYQLVGAVFGAGLMALLVSCSGVDSATQSNRPRIGRLASSFFGESFERLWEERTILLGQFSGGGAPFPSTPGGQRGNASPFPLTVRATILDSTLVEAGIQEFARLASMKADELQTFRQTYRSQHFLDEYIFVEAELQTFLSENYLQLDRWVIFLEDDNRNQYEPRRVEKDPPQKSLARFQPGGGRGNQEGRFAGMGASSFSTQRIELYFPRYRYARIPVVGPETGSIKLVVVDARDSNVRAEEKWNFFSNR